MCVETDRTIVLRLQGRRSGRTTKRPQRQTRSVSDCDEEKCGCQACCLDQYRYRCVFLTSFRHFVLRLRGEHREEVSAGDVLADQIVEGLCLDLIVEARDALLALGDRVEELLLDGERIGGAGLHDGVGGQVDGVQQRLAQAAGVVVDGVGGERRLVGSQQQAQDARLASHVLQHGHAGLRASGGGGVSALARRRVAELALGVHQLGVGNFDGNLTLTVSVVGKLQTNTKRANKTNTQTDKMSDEVERRGE